MAKAVAIMMVAVLVVVAAMSSPAVVVVVEGQTLPPCASALLPCAAYLQDPLANPPMTCCMPLTQAVNTELPCLCSLLASPEFLKAFNATGDQAMLLLSSCGIATLDLCTAPASLPSSGPPSSSPPSPPLPPASEPSASPSTSSPSPPLPPALQPYIPSSAPASMPSYSPPSPAQASPITSAAYHVHWIGLTSLMSLVLTWWSLIA